MPRVSVIIPSYNHERFVGEAIQSVLDQTFQDFELIITDDGSRDRSVEIIKEFTDPRIRIFCFEKNRGSCAATNNNLAYATGEYIAVLSSDDAFVPEKLERQVAFLDQHPEIGAVFSYAQIIDENGNEIARRDHYYTRIFEQHNRPRYQWLEHFFYWDNCLCHPSILIRRECYETVGVYDERLAQLPDLEFWIRLCARYEIYVLPEHLIRFRILANEANSSSQFRPSALFRHQVELPQVLKHYLRDPIRADFKRIFSEDTHEVQKEDLELVPFFVALQAVRTESPPRRAFALETLYTLFREDPKMPEILAERFGFDYKSLIELAGKLDIFGALAPQQLQQMHTQALERDNTITALRAQLGQQEQALRSAVESLGNQLAEHVRQYQLSEQRATELDQALAATTAAAAADQERRQATQEQLEAQVESLRADLEQNQRLLTHERATLRQQIGMLSWRLDRLNSLLPIRAARKLKRLLTHTSPPAPLPLFEGSLDLPAANSSITGAIEVYGWAISRAGAIQQVEVYFDSTLLGLATYGFHRPDVGTFLQSSELASSGFTGRFGVTHVDLRAEQHYVTVRVIDSQNNRHDFTRPIRLDDDSFSRWITVNEPTQADLERQRALAALFTYQPLISVVVPVYNTPRAVLCETIESVLEQTYGHWELCLVDGASTRAEVREVFGQYQQRDQRIRVQVLESNQGIAGNTNAGLQMAKGEFIALLDHDDTLSPDALFENVAALNNDRTIDVIYSDQDKITDTGSRFEPFFKPDWSPELFRGVMYVGHLLCVRRSLALAVDGFRSEYDGVQDYEFMLRIGEQTQKIHHIPKILYHWRTLVGSVARDTDAKSGIDELQRLAVDEHLKRLGLSALAVATNGRHRIHVEPLPLEREPLVSIIIPTRDAPQHLERCLHSIFHVSSYRNYEVILVDNETSDERALQIMKQFPVQRVMLSNPFNYSRANNLGVQHAQGEYLLFLNNDTEVLSPDWLQHLVYYAQQPDVGAVGGLLLYPNRTVQHAGIVLGFRGTADHVMRGFPHDSDGYAGSLLCAREVSAVTGACLMVARSLYEEVGGFNEHFFTHYQDVDLCLQFARRNRRNLYVPGVKLIHYESVSRKEYYDIVDRMLLLDCWQENIERGDPFYNTNFDLSAFNYTIRVS